MFTHVSSTVRQLRSYFDGLLRQDETTGVRFVRDDELGDRASCCTTGEVACFYLLDEALHGGDGKDIALSLVEDVRNRQLESGAFGQPYNVRKGDPGTVDIAEIGAVANSLYHVHRLTGSAAAKASLMASADYLLTQIAVENPGAVYKNPNAKEHDVLNGDVYAAHTWGRAYELTGDDKYREPALAVMRHVNGRFGVNDAGWWPYIEHWDGTVGMGNSVAYQGTIVGFAHTLLPLLPDDLRADWGRTAAAAVATMLKELPGGPNDDNEAPYWCRDWRNAWEIYLAFSRFPAETEAGRAVEECLTRVNGELSERSICRFKPASMQQDPERSPVTTTFRKAATFAGILSYMVLDNKDRANIGMRK